MLKWDLEGERLVVIWVEGALLYRCLLLAKSLSILHQSNFHVRIWNWEKRLQHFNTINSESFYCFSTAVNLLLSVLSKPHGYFMPWSIFRLWDRFRIRTDYSLKFHRTPSPITVFLYIQIIFSRTLFVNRSSKIEGGIRSSKLYINSFSRPLLG